MPKTPKSDLPACNRTKTCAKGASDVFIKFVNEKLNEFCTDEYAIQALKRIA